MIELRRRHSGSKGSDSPSFSRLPAGYQEVEYLENTKTQYINLDLSLPNGFIFESYVNVISTYGDYGVVLGCHEVSAPYKRNYLTFPYINSNGYSIGCGDYSYVSGYAIYNDRVKIKASTLIGNNYLFINDNLYVENDYIGERSGRTIYLFASHNRSQLEASQFFIGRIEDAKIYDEHEELVRHLIPCYRISDRKPGMYDIVNDVFYTNAGTGEFSYGQDVHSNIPFEYQEVEYLETQGDGAYIKTNVLYDSTQDDYEIECKYLITQRTDFAHIFGASEGGNYNNIIFAQSNAYNSYLAFFNKSTISMHYRFANAYGYSIGTICKFSVSNITMSDTENNSQIIITESGQGAIGHESINKVTFCLFKSDQNLNTPLYVRAYAYSIRKGNVTLCNLIPCFRKSDNVAGMYDLVSGEFYTNAGTGTFDVGPLVI